MKAILAASAFVVASLPVSAGLILEIESFTATALAIRLTGTVEGAFPGDFPDLNRNRLYLEEASGADWIQAPFENFAYTVTASAQPLEFFDYSFGRAFSGTLVFGDIVFLQFNAATSIAGDTGTDMLVTLIPEAGVTFNTGAVGELVLTWGVVEDEGAPYIGILQSSVIVPEPAHAGLLIGGAALGVLALRRRRA